MATVRHDTHETRQRLIEAAERLFARQGYAATSVRDLTTEAGCNVAAVNYHFGGKDRLYVETFRNLLPEIRDRRLEIVERAMTEGDGDATLETFLEAFAEAIWDPFVDESRGRLLMGFFMHEILDPRLPSGVFRQEFADPLMDMAANALQRLEPGLDEPTARMCAMSVVGQILHAFKARRLFLHDGGPSSLPADIEAHIRHIVRFSAAGVRALTVPLGTNGYEES
jgi:AcrR family transcriptional regulator